MRLYKVDIKKNGTHYEAWIHDDGQLEEIDHVNPDSMVSRMECMSDIRAVVNWMKQYQIKSFEVKKEDA